jgi:hypothetical protein
MLENSSDQYHPYVRAISARFAKVEFPVPEVLR